MKKVLVIGDLVGHEKIGLSAVIPILSNMECDVNNLLTSLVSNTFDYGISEMADLTGYMEGTLAIWKKLNFKFDVIYIGLINSMRQVELIEDLIAFNNSPLVICDPIMGDDGALYMSLTDEVVNYTKRMVNSSNLIIPNLTEACLLLDKTYPEDMDEDFIICLIKDLSQSGKSVCVTSVKIGSKHYVYGIDNFQGESNIFKVEFDLIPHKFAGTGDIFSALVTGKLGQGSGLEDAVAYACSKISEILGKESVGKEEVKSVQIERYLKQL